MTATRSQTEKPAVVPVGFPVFTPSAGCPAPDFVGIADQEVGSAAATSDAASAERVRRAEPTDSTVSRLVQAAMGFDVDVLSDYIRMSITDRGAAWTWERLIHPVWNALGGESDAAGAPVVAERLFRRAMAEVLAAASRPSNRAPTRVLLAGADDEDRTLPLDVLAAALAESGVGTCVLGARVPPQAIAASVGRLHPIVVVIWSQTPKTADPRQIASVLSARPSSTVIAAGPGWVAGDIGRISRLKAW